MLNRLKKCLSRLRRKPRTSEHQDDRVEEITALLEAQAGAAREEDARCAALQASNERRQAKLDMMSAKAFAERRGSESGSAG